jgi:hypothetical protein
VIRRWHFLQFDRTWLQLILDECRHEFLGHTF